MAKIDPNFPHDMFKFIHKPIRDEDAKNFNFLERFLLGMQQAWEERIYNKIGTLNDLLDPSKTPQPRLLKDHVGFTKELDFITNNISDNDLRKIISLAVELFKKKGLEVGYSDIIRVFTGSNVRIFNWFDFRYIVGEKSIGEEQLGQDSWFISLPGVSQITPNVDLLGLWRFDGNTFDSSFNRNTGCGEGDISYYEGGAFESVKYISFGSPGDLDFLPRLGYVSIDHSNKYDFSESLTFEGFIRTSIDQDSLGNDNDGYIFSKTDGSIELSLEFKVSTNQLIANINDGTLSFSITLNSTSDLDDNLFRHWALVIDRPNNLARLYLNGTESDSVDITGLGDLTSFSKLFINANGHSIGTLLADHDSFRISKEVVYDTSLSTLPVPALEFIGYVDEQLDEFFSDIRVVDDGSGELDRVLLKRIINLMRPISERLNIIYVTFSDDFRSGKGNFLNIQGSTGVDLDNRIMTLNPSTIEVVDVFNADNFKNIVVQFKLKIQDLNQSGGVIFNYQDVENYYYFRMVSPPTRIFQLIKVETGVENIIGSDVIADIEENTDYVLSVQTFENNSNGIKILCFQDGNVIFDIDDNTFVDGRFGVRSDTSSVVVVSEVEMFEQPLETETILPGFTG